MQKEKKKKIWVHIIYIIIIVLVILIANRDCRERVQQQKDVCRSQIELYDTLRTLTTTNNVDSSSAKETEILSHTINLKKDDNKFVLVGEVKNKDSEPIDYPKIYFTGYDKDNQVVCTDYEYTEFWPESLYTDETTPFKLEMYLADCPNIKMYKLKFESSIVEDTVEVLGIDTETLEPEEKISEIGHGRSNPAPKGVPLETELDYYYSIFKGRVTLLDFKRGQEAFDIIQDAYPYIEEPAEGKEYVIIKIKFDLIETLEDKPYTISHYSFSLVSEDGVVYDDRPLVLNFEPELDKTLYPGASHEGWFTLEVDTTDEKPLLAFYMGIPGELWFKLY